MLRHAGAYEKSVSDKTEQDIEREQSLVDQWVGLTEERNAVLVPASGLCIPGAPADWTPPAGMEPHVPVLFLDLNGESTAACLEEPRRKHTWLTKDFFVVLSLGWQHN